MLIIMTTSASINNDDRHRNLVKLLSIGCTWGNRKSLLKNLGNFNQGCAGHGGQSLSNILWECPGFIHMVNKDFVGTILEGLDLRFN